MEIVFTIILLLFYGVSVAYLMWKLFCMEPIYHDGNDYRAFPNFSTKHFLVSFRIFSPNSLFFRNIRKLIENRFKTKKTGNFENKVPECHFSEIFENCFKTEKLENSKIKELKNKFAFEPGPYLVRKEKIILSQVACNYYKNIKIDAAKVKMRKNGKCERLTHFTLSLCQL